MFKKRILKNKIAKQQIVIALRIYMSAILTLISSQKEILLQKTGFEGAGVIAYVVLHI
jgi:hypothetical protein